MLQKLTNFLLPLCICAPLLTNAQWTRLTPNYAENMSLYDVYAKGPRIIGVGYDGNFDGHTIQSEDDGKNWDTTRTDGLLQKTIAFKDADTGFIAGYGSITFFMRSVDGGKTWETPSIDTSTKGVADMLFLNDKQGFAAGYGSKQFFSGNCFSTGDGGRTWVPSDTTDPVLDTIGIERIFFLDAQTGYAVNNFFGGTALLKTTNGGRNFTLHYTHSDNIGDIHFWNVNNGILVDGSGKIYKTTDGGKNWTLKASPSSGLLNSLVFLNESIGYTVGYAGFIASTADGGETWTKDASYTNATLLRVRSYDGNIYASGNRGTILRKGWPANVRETSVAYKLNIYPNPASSVLNISAVNNCYKTVSASLSDLNGKVLRTGAVTTGVITMDIRDIPAGIYTVSVQADGHKHQEKITVTH